MGDTPLDLSIMRSLPPGTTFVSAERHGKTNFAEGWRLQVEKDGDRVEYFVKITKGKTALIMVEGEFESQKAMKEAIPDHVTKPVAFGSLAADQSKGFYICKFRHLDAIKPSPKDVARILATLHQQTSPTGKFGFHVPTCKAFMPMDNGWCDTFEEWFGRQFQRDVEFEQSVRGPDPEMDELLPLFKSVVIPRLLRPLEAVGKIMPRLVHTDIWHGNMHTDCVTRRPFLFDACCVYGHAEMDLGMFRGTRYGWSDEYLREYLNLVPVSAPVQDFDDRVAIYAIRNYIVSAGLWAHWASMRTFVKEEIRRLLRKFHNDYLLVEASYLED